MFVLERDCLSLLLSCILAALSIFHRFLESNASHFIHAVNELEPNSWMNEVC